MRNDELAKESPAGAGGYDLGFTELETQREVEQLPVTGEIPHWLTGTLVRNGPGTWSPADSSLRHWFDGTAMLHAFGFDESRISYANRYLQTNQTRHLEDTGKIGYSEFATDPCRSIFKRVMSTFFPPDPREGFGHNASINVAELAGRYVALTETPLPVEFEPKTLKTAGVVEFSDDFETTGSSPHPHTDPLTGDYINHGTHFSGSSSYKLFRVRAGYTDAVQRQEIARIEAKQPAYMHSFGQSLHYAVLAEYPLVVNPLKMLATGRPFAENLEWKPDRPTRFWVIRKSDGEVFGPRDGPPMFSFHHVNAFEEQGDLYVDLAARDDAAVIDRLYLDYLTDPEQNADSVAELRRIRIPEPESEADGAEPVQWWRLSGTLLELPRINYERVAGREYRYVYGTGAAKVAEGHRSENPGSKRAANQGRLGARGGGYKSRTGENWGYGWLDRLVKVDLRTGESKIWREEGTYPGEPVFVERPGPAKERGAADAEDDGVILSVVLDPGKGRSFLLVLDAASFEELGRAEAPHHIPHGFHGSYLSGVPGHSSETVSATRPWYAPRQADDEQDTR